jgi:hypothetical protein
MESGLRLARCAVLEIRSLIRAMLSAIDMKAIIELKVLVVCYFHRRLRNLETSCPTRFPRMKSWIGHLSRDLSSGDATRFQSLTRDLQPFIGRLIIAIPKCDVRHIPDVILGAD